MLIRQVPLLLIYIFFTSCATTPGDTQNSCSRAIATPRTVPGNYSTPAPKDSVPEKTQYYIVKRGDSLKLIADKFNIAIEKIIAKNHIGNPDDLRIGQLLIIPGSGRQDTNMVFFWPVKGKIVGFFGESSGNIENKGLKIKTTSQTCVKAAQDGEVIFSDYLKGWGKTVVLKHDGGFYTVYANLIGTITKEGLSVKKGDAVGKLALNQRNGEDTLYFEIRRGSLAQNPLRYLR